jgi:hypothetical protein
MQEIADWLTRLGLPEYAGAFAENGTATRPNLSNRRRPRRHRPKPWGERRHVTVMFCDLVPSVRRVAEVLFQRGRLYRDQVNRLIAGRWIY